MQGVGFRPFVYRLATQLGLLGRASNQPDGVHIYVSGDAQTVQQFYDRLATEAPPLAQVQQQSIEQIAEQVFKDFQILKTTDESAAANLVLTPDLAMCEACRHDIKNKRNRRYGYAFTTCTNCGPRFSILARLPFERENTTMAAFTMCPDCQREYHNPEDRRYYAQTNSCPRCAVSLSLYTSLGQKIEGSQQELITATAQLIQEGSMVAVKGLGGYLILADATNLETVRELRQRKHRPSKPFALMYPNINLAQQDVQLDNQEKQLLLSPASPIVLAAKKPNPGSGIAQELIAPNLNHLGVLLPYTPLFECLLSALQQPVIATSANSHGNPIIYRDDNISESLGKIADFILCHDRQIVVGQDDSVVTVTPRHQQQIILRRARGYAPAYLASMPQPMKQPLLAMGADLKSAFAFTSSGQTCVSQYLGDLGKYDNQLHFEYNLGHLATLYGFHPKQILIDKHPGYTSSMMGKQLAKAHAIPCVEVQHHQAHFAAVLAENDLLTSDEPVLGVIWDGNGYGHDGRICGGEFLLFQHGQISPLANLSPFPHVLGDKMAKEPRLSALSLCQDIPEALNILKPYFSSTEWDLYRSTLSKTKYKQETTSMGRLFDGVAALLGLCQTQTYEGEAAMLLEALAGSGPEVYLLQGYTLPNCNHQNIPVKDIISQIIEDIQQHVSRQQIAANFHVTLVHLVSKIATTHGLQNIAFSGGVFQNSLLVDLLITKLKPQHTLYFHRQLPPNDACIAFGQLSWLQLQQQPKSEKLSAKNQRNAQQTCV